MSNRRRGAEDSRTRMQLIEEAMQLLVDEGVGALTARRLAQRVGLSHQIVHYYFRSMDDLLVAVVQHGEAVEFARIQLALDSDEPLTAMRDLNSPLMEVVIGTEVEVYAHRRPAVREAVQTAIERLRRGQTAAMAKHFEKQGLSGPISPEVGAVLATLMLRMLALEKALGISAGHDETMRWLVSQLEAPMLNASAHGDGAGLVHPITAQAARR